MATLVFLTTTATWLLALHDDAIDVKPGKQLPQSVTLHVAGDNGETKDVNVRYLLFTPEGYKDDGEPWPLLLFLHGYGECSDTDLDLVKVHGPPRIVDSKPDFPFVVVSPQTPALDRDFAKIVKAWNPDELMMLVHHVAKKLNIDPQRIYVTGLSMGGYGTWRLAAKYPERFAAAAPICGGGDPQEMVKGLTKIPIWAFHGAKDQIVPLLASEDMVNAVKTAGGDVKLTVYPEVGHDSWVQAYDDPALYDWLLAHQRK